MIYPGKISDEGQLEEFLSNPSPDVINMFSRLKGDIILLGVSGKIGPSLARMAKRASDQAGVKRRIVGVAKFEKVEQRNAFEHSGIETIAGNLLNPQFIKSLPAIGNVIFLAGMKFGSGDNLSLTWAVNTYLPALVAEHYKESRIVAFSTGCVYPLVPVEGHGSVESDMPYPVGEYAQSCLGRERMFEYACNQFKTNVCLIRLNYSVELRYGVLVDIALKVKNGIPVDLMMGHFNVIWQGDMNNFVLLSLEHCSSPAKVLNITGPDTLLVRDVASKFGKLFGIKPIFINKEASTALLSNSSLANSLFGNSEVSAGQVISWIAEWIKEGKKILSKPTHFEVRDGKY